MREQENLQREQSRRAYAVNDEKVGSLIEELLRELQPYSNADILRDVFVTAVKMAQDGADRGDAKITRTAMKELRYAFRVFSAYRDHPKVSIFGSARVVDGQPEFEATRQLGAKMAEAGYLVITGAGPGIMAAGHLGAGQAKSFGLNIRLPFEQLPNPTINGDRKLINFRYFFTRKLFFVKESEAIVLMPGGFGTLDEGFEVLTLVQTGKSEIKPIVMLDVPGGTYWKDWFAFIEKQLLGRGFISPEDRALFCITDNVDTAVSEIQTFYRVYHSARFVDHRRRLVLRLKQPPDPRLLEVLNEKFQDIIVEGKIELTEPFPEERDEPKLLKLSRLALAFDQRQYSRLRQLIDAVNRFS
ncbi:MAG: TIGR00730 family Rossman fold protein [Acidobacteria bacterium]|nr:MAG: TIGR00730 family Rossman fold protein [Acidobacteriota bacterium]